MTVGTLTGWFRVIPWKRVVNSGTNKQSGEGKDLCRLELGHVYMFVLVGCCIYMRIIYIQFGDMDLENCGSGCSLNWFAGFLPSTEGPSKGENKIHVLRICSDTCRRRGANISHKFTLGCVYYILWIYIKYMIFMHIDIFTEYILYTDVYLQPKWPLLWLRVDFISLLEVSNPFRRRRQSQDGAHANVMAELAAAPYVKAMKKRPRWWFQICFIFIPIWGNDPIWLIFFQLGWNHQLVELQAVFF